MKNSYPSALGVKGVIVTSLVLIFWSSMAFQASAATTVYTDKSQFIAATGATSVTGTLPNMGHIVPNNENIANKSDIKIRVGSVLFSTASYGFWIGGGTQYNPWTNLIPGNAIAIDGKEHLNVDLDSPAYSVGFDFAEPRYQYLYSHENGAGWVDSTFQVTLLMNGSSVDSFQFNSPNDTLAFNGVTSTLQFNRIEIRELNGTDDNEFFGQFYTKTTPPVVSAGVCSTNSQCGTNTLTGSPFCQGAAIYQNYITYTCNNPGQANSSCSSSTAPQLQSNCVNFSGTPACSNGSCVSINNQCSDGVDNDSDGKIDSNDPGCHYDLNPLNSTSYEPNFNNEARNNVGQCSDGIDNDNDGRIDALDPDCHTDANPNNNSSYDGRRNESTIGSTGVCSNNSQCGTNSYTGSPFCSGSNVFQNYTTYTCNNPGQTNSSCSSNVAAQQQASCAFGQTCSNGSCVTTTQSCTQNASQRCVGNAVYWYDSCGNQQSLAQTCLSNQTCQFNACVLNSPICTQNTSQRCVGNAVHWYDSCGNQGALTQTCGVNQICSNNTCVTSNQTQSSLLVTQTVRNLSSGNLTWVNSVSAGPSDILQFQIVVSTTGNQTVNNVTVRNIFPANLIYTGNLTLDGVSNPGSIATGLNIGTVNPGQTRIITYQAQVAPAANFPFGTTTFTNSITASSTDPGSNPSTGSTTISVTRGGVLGATIVSTGLTNNPFVDSFFIPLMIALVGFWIWKSRVAALPEWVGGAQTKNQETAAQRLLQSKIEQIKEKERS